MVRIFMNRRCAARLLESTEQGIISTNLQKPIFQFFQSPPSEVLERESGNVSPDSGKPDSPTSMDEENSPGNSSEDEEREKSPGNSFENEERENSPRNFFEDDEKENFDKDEENSTFNQKDSQWKGENSPGNEENFPDKEATKNDDSCAVSIKANEEKSSGQKKQRVNCELCQKTFPNNLGLKKHTRTAHFICTICARPFLGKDDLEVHVENYHPRNIF